MEKLSENLNDLWEYVEKYKPQIEKSLREHLPSSPTKIKNKFDEAIESALSSEGEMRLRAVLVLLGAELFGGKVEDVLPSAAAVEFTGASSRIFGELSCMSNAESEKDSLSNNFGEGLTILVALGLLNASYPLVFVNYIGMPERAMQAHAEIVECVGDSGLIGGIFSTFAMAKDAENLDSESGGSLKTVAQMRLALRVGAILAGADYIDLANISRFGELFGNAYLLTDNLINISKENDFEETGKSQTANQEKKNAQHNLSNLIEEAKGILFDNFPSNEARSCLIQLTEYLAERES